jgi:folate-binding protein YgfZ
MGTLHLHSQQVYTTVEEEYWTLRKSSALFIEERGFLQLSGAESIDFLQRLSTNDFTNFDRDSTVTTILTTEKGKIVDLCTALYVHNRLLLITSPRASEKVKTWLEKYIIMEDIHVTDVTSEYVMISFIGSYLNSMIKGPTYLHTHPENNQVLALDNDVVAFRDACFKTVKTNIVSDKQKYRESVYFADLVESNPYVGTIAVDSLRIEEGVPYYGAELTETYNPLEASLDRFVSFTKGCYIGQEVIARLDTYKKLQRKLSGFIIRDSTINDRVEGSKLYYNNEEVGIITSQAWSPRVNMIIALGYVKTGISITSVQLQPPDRTTSLTVEIIPLPITSI